MTTRKTIVAINGSPHVGFGNTAQMLEMLRPPIEEAGLDLEIINLAEQDIQYCVGCAVCMEKGACWIKDEHKALVKRLLAADGVILASPVYFFHVTAQMKTFLDRCLAFGHKPRPTWKPGAAVCVSAGLGETDVGAYLASVLRVFGAYSSGILTAMATGPGGFIGRDAVEQQAEDVSRGLIRAIQEKRRVPPTDQDLRFYQFMSNLIKSHQHSVMQHDHQHWEEHGLYDGFERYIQQTATPEPEMKEVRQAWVKELMATGRNRSRHETAAGPEKTNARDFSSCRELIEAMPLGFQAENGQNLNAVYQFEVSGDEVFTAHLQIADGTCSYHAGPARNSDVVIQTPADVWLAVAQGELDGQQAFMSGKYRAHGDLGLLMRLNELFN